MAGGAHKLEFFLSHVMTSRPKRKLTVLDRGQSLFVSFRDVWKGWKSEEEASIPLGKGWCSLPSEQVSQKARERKLEPLG